MARPSGPILVDTNVILECWRLSAWKALARGYGVETVEDCVVETQTGFQRRRAEQQVDNAELRASLAAIHQVGLRSRPRPRCAIPTSRRSISASGCSGPRP